MAIYGAEEDHVKNIFGDEYQVFSIGRGQLGVPVKHPNEMETKHIGLEFKNCFKVETWTGGWVYRWYLKFGMDEVTYGVSPESKEIESEGGVLAMLKFKGRKNEEHSA